MGTAASSNGRDGAPRSGDPRPGLDPRVRAHLITSLILVFAVAAIALVWTRPILLLWLFLAVVAIMGYAAVYLLVSARLVEDEEAEEDASARPRPPRPAEGAAPPPEDEDEA